MSPIKHTRGSNSGYLENLVRGGGSGEECGGRGREFVTAFSVLQKRKKRANKEWFACDTAFRLPASLIISLALLRCKRWTLWVRMSTWNKKGGKGVDFLPGER